MLQYSWEVWCLETVAADLSTGRVPSNICDHFKEMVSKVRSAVSITSVDKLFLLKLTDSENDEALLHRRKKYAQDLLSSQTANKALGTSAWWDADVLHELLMLMKTYDEEKGTSSSQNRVQIKATSEIKKRKFSEEQKAKQDEMKKRQEEENRQKDEEHRLKGAMVDNDTKKLDLASKMNDSFNSLSQTIALAVAPASNDNAINTRLRALEESQEVVNNKLDLLLAKLIN